MTPWPAPPDESRAEASVWCAIAAEKGQLLEDQTAVPGLLEQARASGLLHQDPQERRATGSRQEQQEEPRLGQQQWEQQEREAWAGLLQRQSNLTGLLQHLKTTLAELALDSRDKKLLPMLLPRIAAILELYSDATCASATPTSSTTSSSKSPSLQELAETGLPEVMDQLNEQPAVADDEGGVQGKMLARCRSVSLLLLLGAVLQAPDSEAAAAAAATVLQSLVMIRQQGAEQVRRRLGLPALMHAMQPLLSSRRRPP
jgi:hypothetical protein